MRNLLEKIYGKALRVNTTVISLLEIAIYISLVLIWYKDFLFNNKIGIFDWSQLVYWHTFLKQSIVQFKEYPFSFLSLPPSVGKEPMEITLSFLANPQMPLFSPFMILVPMLETISYLKVYFALHFLVGIIGIFLLARHFNFNVLSKAYFFLLTILNPWIMQHLAIGYVMYISVCYVPLAVWFLLRSDRRPVYIVCAALMSGLIHYQGAVQVFNRLNLGIFIFIILYALISRKAEVLARAFLYYIGVFLLVFPKIFIVLQCFKGYNVPLVGSYSSWHDIFGLLTDLQAPLYNLPEAYNTYGTCIYDASVALGYWFIALLIIAAIFFIVRLFRERLNINPIPCALIFSSLFFIFLGWNGVWAKVASIVPFLSCERYPFRFLIISVIFLVFFVCYELNKIPRKVKKKIIVILLLILLGLGKDVYNRVQYFNKVGSVNDDRFRNFSLTEYFDRTLNTSTRSNVQIAFNKITPNNIIFQAAGEGNAFKRGDMIYLGWLKPRNVKDFNVVNADFLTVKNEVFVRPVAGAAEIRITPDTYNFFPLLIVCMVFFLIYAFSLTGVYRYLLRKKR